MIVTNLCRCAGAALAAMLLLSLAAAPAQAQLARTFVSNAVGNDANDCNRLTPCRTFQRAHDNTFANGEITVLDPGGYGGVTITKAISIINDGVGEAGVLVSGGANGITINATASDAVSLRGLTIKGIGFGGGRGIVFDSGGSLTVENCAIRTLTGVVANGITFEPNGPGSLTVLNTIVSDNAGDGIHVQPGTSGSGNVSVSLSQVQLINNSFGLVLANGLGSSTVTIDAAVEDGIAAESANGGFLALSNGPKSNLMLIRSVAAHNGTSGGIGVQGPNATLRVGQSTITGNAISWKVTSGGLLQSYGDNNIDGNADGDPAIPTIIAKK